MTNINKLYPKTFLLSNNDFSCKYMTNIYRHFNKAQEDFLIIQSIMSRIEKKMNKRLIGLIIGGALLGVGDESLTKKTKRLWRKIFNFFIEGVRELKKEVEK